MNEPKKVIATIGIDNPQTPEQEKLKELLFKHYDLIQSNTYELLVIQKCQN